MKARRKDYGAEGRHLNKMFLNLSQFLNLEPSG